MPYQYTGTRFKGLMRLKTELQATNIVAGQMILCSDSQELYFDKTNSDRVQIKDVEWLMNEEERLSITPIENKIYIVRATCHLWTYLDGAWSDLSTESVAPDLSLKANKSIGIEVILPYTSWSINKTITVNVFGVTAINNLSVAPKINELVDYSDKYSEFNIKCIKQLEGSLIFKCDIIPNQDIIVNVIIFD